MTISLAGARAERNVSAASIRTEAEVETTIFNGRDVNGRDRCCLIDPRRQEALRSRTIPETASGRPGT